MSLSYYRFISVPKDMGAFNCGAYVAGIVKVLKLNICVLTNHLFCFLYSLTFLMDRVFLMAQDFLQEWLRILFLLKGSSGPKQRFWSSLPKRWGLKTCYESNLVQRIYKIVVQISFISNVSLTSWISIRPLLLGYKVFKKKGHDMCCLFNWKP